MMKRLRRHFAALSLGALLLTSSAQAVTLTLDGRTLELGETPVYQNTTYVSLRLLTEEVWPNARVSWSGGQAVVRRNGSTLTAAPGENVLLYNGQETALELPVRLENGRTLVPVRPLAALLDLTVDWDQESREVALTSRKRPSSSSGSSSGSSGSQRPSAPVEEETESPSWTQDELYWLSRIISAESRGESWEGKIAVGNVVLNRVQSPEFPDTIYGVIFDDRWGGQFEPVRNGTVYDEPTQESVEAAKACLEGANTVGASLYFLAPALTDNHWTMENRTYVTTIGAHWFYE